MLDNFTNHQLEGLSKDRTFEGDQAVTFALNAIKNSHDGGVPEYQSEPGNNIDVVLPIGSIYLGHIYGQNNEVYLFFESGRNDTIALYKEGKYEVLVQAPFDFDVNFPITGEYRVRNGCEPIIYWSDHKNPDRWFNPSRPNDFKTSGLFDVEKFSFRPQVDVPIIGLLGVNDTGGTLAVGSYMFQFEVLDSNKNTLYKTDITPQTPIYDDSFSKSYDQIDGAVNYPQFDQLAGGVPLTTKSITLQIGNLNPNQAKWIRVNVAYQTTANQVIQAHTVGTLIPVSSNVTWTYTGFNPNSGDSQITYQEMLVDNVNYQSSYVMEQVQNRLVRANLKEKVRDYSLYQAEATNIITRWIASEVRMKDQTDLGNPKNPNTYWLKTTFQGDEVYAFGVQYLHTDGSWSPVFHIPGREATTTDTQLLTVVSNATTLTGTTVWLSDVEHLGLVIDDTIERWKVFNTAIITDSNTVTHPYDWAGEFGYYEAGFNYPDIRNCEGDLIWGGSITTSDKVRFHRFPSRAVMSHITDIDHIVPLGVEFIVSTYPASDVIGHRFCHITRDEFNRTVTDSGWGNNEVIISTGSEITEDLVNTITLNGFHNSASPNNYLSYFSPTINYDKKLSTSEYLVQTRVFRVDTDLLSTPFLYDNENGNQITNGIVYTNDIQNTTLTRTNIKVDKQYYIESGERVQDGVLEIINDDYLTSSSVIKIITPNESYLTQNGGQSAGTSITPPGDFFCNGNIVYYHKKVTRSIYQNFLNLQYQYINYNPVLGNSTTQHYSGDSLLTCHKTARLATYTVFKLNDNTAPLNAFETIYSDLFWCEAPINASLQYRGLSDELRYFNKGDFDWKILEHFATLLNESTSPTSFVFQMKPRTEWYPNYYKVNPDLNLQANEQPKLGLPDSYDYCVKCLGEYPNRIIFSPVSFEEEEQDLYRISKVNDYIDIPAHRGRITGLQYTGQSLLVLCEDATFILQPNPQVVQTDQSQAYLTTGDFLSIPPVEILKTDLGFAGCQNKQHQVNTPFGFCWVDQRRGQIFKFDNQIEELNIGLTQWLKENLPSELQRNVWSSDKVKYPYTSTPNTNGVGMILYYDPRFKRLLISKTDWQYVTYPIPLSGVIYNNGDWQWKVGNVLTPITFKDPDYFQNKSWTLSYDFNYQKFISWHSYIPYGAFSDDYNFFTFIHNSAVIYKHLDKQRYQRFYASKYDFIVELCNYKLATERLNAIHYEGYTLEWDSTNKVWLEIPETFNKFIAYNNKQSTGLQNLNLATSPYQNTVLGGNTKWVQKKDQNYKIAGIFDMATTQPVMTADWTTLQTYSGYIDQLPINIDFTKSIYNSGDLWDKFVYIRLIGKPEADAKILVSAIQLNKQYSIR